MYRLLFQAGPYKGKRLTIQQGTVVIGRDPDCHIHLQDDELSWRHAVLEERDDGVYIRDLGSLNKIVVNTGEVRDARLNHGDEIVLGQTRIRFQQIKVGFVEEGRRVTHIQGVTFASVALIVLLEIILLVALAAWRVDRGGGLQFAAMEEESAAAQSEAAGGKAEATTDASEPEPEPPAAPEPEAREPAEAVAEPEPEAEAAAPAVEPERAEEAREEEPAAPPETAPPPAVEEAPAPTEAPAAGEQRVAKVIELPPMTPEAAEGTNETGEAEEPALDEEEIRSEQPSFMAAGTTAAADPLLQLAKEMFEEARLEVQKHNLVQADQQFERLQIVAPDFYPAYVERAILYESRGMLKEAGEQWAELLGRCGGTPWHAYAAEQRSRVAQEEGMRANIRPPQGARGTPERPERDLPKRLTVDSVQRQQFTTSDEFDEMRLITITLRHRQGDPSIEGEDVKVIVTFYDRDEKTEEIHLTQAFVPEESLVLKGPWPLGERRTVSAAYIVPKGFRKKEEKDFGNPRGYYGYMVRLYHEGVLQDEASRPKSLLKQFPAYGAAAE